MSSAEDRVLDAAKRCCERWGLDKVTIDDIANDSGVSRATLYRLFPGGKDVLFEALRVRELDEFFTVLRAEVEGAGSFEDLIVRTVVCATRELRADEHLALMLGSEPGETLSQLTVDGLPRIIRVASAYLVPLVSPYLEPDERDQVDRRARPTRHLVLPRPERPRRPRRRTLRQGVPPPPHRRLHRGGPPSDMTHNECFKEHQ